MRIGVFFIDQHPPENERRLARIFAYLQRTVEENGNGTVGRVYTG